MSHAPRSRPAKRRTNRKAASEALFNPAVFLETTAQWSSHFHAFEERGHLCPGRRCRCGFLYQEGQGQSRHRIQRGQGSRHRAPGARRICGRRMLDRTAEALGDSLCNDGMRDDASGQRRKSSGSLMTSPHFRKCLSRIFWRGAPGSKKTWPISSSTQPKNGLRGCCCCWPILERKAERSPFSRRSVRRHSLR